MRRPELPEDARQGRDASLARFRRDPEVSFTAAPQIKPGTYVAYCRSAALYRDGQFKRWVCAVQFDVLDSSGINVLARVTWYMNLGSRKTPNASRRGNYWRAWIRANGRPPGRRDRMSPRIFERRCAIVLVADTEKTYNSGCVKAAESYSVIRDVIEWQTGGSVGCE
jgi:hypothetical protein